MALFCLGQVLVGGAVALCIWLMWREYREHARAREDLRILLLTIRTLGPEWEAVRSGELSIDKFCLIARQRHLAQVERVASGRPEGPAHAE